MLLVQDMVDTLYHDIRDGLEIDMYQVSTRLGACVLVSTMLEGRFLAGIGMCVCLTAPAFFLRRYRCATT